jgi:ferric-chelate reductase
MMNATAELLSEDFVRLRLHPPSYFRWAPGQSAYLIIPSVSRLPFEAHPFTISSIDSNHSDVLDELEPRDQQPNTQISFAGPVLGSSAQFWNELVFFINVRKGFTARLKEAALRGDKVKVFIDGPYGPSPNLGSYDTSVLIAGQWLISPRRLLMRVPLSGGSGVSYTLPLLLDIIEYVHCIAVDAF